MTLVRGTAYVGGQALHPDCTITKRVTAPARFPGDPGHGKIYWGQTRSGGVSAVPARFAKYGQLLGLGRPKITGTFHTFNDNSQATPAGARAGVQDVQTIASWGSFPQIDVKEPNNLSFAQVGQGGMDDVWAALFTGLRDANVDCLVSFHNEAAGDGKGGAAEYGQAAARIKSMRDQAGATRVSLGHALGIGQYTNFGGGNGSPQPWIEAIAPHTELWNTHRYLQATDPAKPSSWKQPSEHYGPFWDMLKAVDPDRAMWQGEWAVHTKPDDPTFAPKWMDSYYQLCLDYGVAGTAFYDSDKNLNQPAQVGWAFDLDSDWVRGKKFAQQLMYTTSVYPA